MIASLLPAACMGTVRALAIRLHGRLALWRSDLRTRTAIATLDAHLLRDIGLDAEPSDRALRRRLLIG
jgi:uncharacterized protein YjiS (DUF1127 family)